jgi:adenylate cyclase
MQKLLASLKQPRLIGFLLIAAFGVFLQLGNLMTFTDNKLLDAQFRYLRDHHPRPIADDVVLVGFDATTEKAFQLPFSLWHPLAADMLKAMSAAKVRVLGLDWVFPDRSYNKFIDGIDNQLAAGIVEARRNIKVAYAITYNEDGSVRHMFDRLFRLSGLIDNSGYVIVNEDKDKVLRRFNEQLADEVEIVTLVGRMARHLGVTPGSGIIDYALGDKVDYIPLHQVVEWYRAGNIDMLQQQFQDRIVIVGPVYKYEDRHLMPVNLAAWETKREDLSNPGVLVHVQALRSILNDRLIQTADKSWILALTLLAALLWLTCKRLISGVTYFILFVAAILLFSTYQLYAGLFLPSTGILLTAGLGFVGRTSFEAVLKARERALLRNTFGRYVSPQIMDEILERRLEATIGGVRRGVCILFSDIRGFTRRSEQMSAEDMIQLLNRYFNRMTSAIHDFNGTLDKFMGDGIMAFFGAPNSLENPARNAFDTAREMLQYLEELNTELVAEGIEPIRIGIGLHYGEAVVGNVGSHDRLEYTAIGDPVNVASRLEGLTKTCGYALMVTEHVYNKLDAGEELEHLGKKEIKGHTPIDVYGWKQSKVV